MRMCSRQQVLIDTHATRQQAADLLKTLEEARRQVEAQLEGDKREDVVRVVTGRSALEAAIANTKRMIEALDRAVEEARNGCVEEVETPELQVVGRIGPAAPASRMALR